MPGGWGGPREASGPATQLRKAAGPIGGTLDLKHTPALATLDLYQCALQQSVIRTQDAFLADS